MRKSRHARIAAIVAELNRIAAALVEINGADGEVTLIDAEHRLRKLLRDLSGLRKKATK